MSAENTLRDRLEALAGPMELARAEPNARVRCVACGHRCLIPEGRQGICKVRFNRGGTLYGPRGYTAGLALDPIEKKPFFHVHPGSEALSFGMLGCDFHCGYCQNWVTSQALRDPGASAGIQPVTPEEIVRLAARHRARVVTSTYNEPLITGEWAVEVFRLAKPEGLVTAFVSNGNNTPEAIDYLRPWLDLCKIDLKGFDDKSYRSLGGTLQNVLDGIERVYRAGMWMELVTLVVPGFNDDPGELAELAGFIAALSPDIPWHVTAFHPDYKMRGPPPTTPDILRRAHGAGKDAGLRYVYAGNLPGRLAGLENTVCPHCSELLVERVGFRVLQDRLVGGHCPQCQAEIPGRWNEAGPGA